MALNAPGGLAYGLAQMAQNIPGSYMEGQRYGLQQKAQQAYDANQNVTYAQNARNLAGQQASDEALAGIKLEDDEDNPMSNGYADQLDAAGSDLYAKGYGKEGQALRGQAQQARQQHTAQQIRVLGQAAGLIRAAVMTGNLGNIPTYAQAIGIPITNVATDPEHPDHVMFMHKSKLLPAGDEDQQGALLEDGSPDPDDPANYQDDDVHLVPKDNLMKLDASAASWQALTQKTMTLEQQKTLKNRDLDLKKDAIDNRKLLGQDSLDERRKYHQGMISVAGQRVAQSANKILAGGNQVGVVIARAIAKANGRTDPSPDDLKQGVEIAKARDPNQVSTRIWTSLNSSDPSFSRLPADKQMGRVQSILGGLTGAPTPKQQPKAPDGAVPSLDSYLTYRGF